MSSHHSDSRARLAVLVSMIAIVALIAAGFWFSWKDKRTKDATRGTEARPDSITPNAGSSGKSATRDIVDAEQQAALAEFLNRYPELTALQSRLNEERKRLDREQPLLVEVRKYQARLDAYLQERYSKQSRKLFELMAARPELREVTTKSLQFDKALAVLDLMQATDPLGEGNLADISDLVDNTNYFEGIRKQMLSLEQTFFPADSDSLQIANATSSQEVIAQLQRLESKYAAKRDMILGDSFPPDLKAFLRIDNFIALTRENLNAYRRTKTQEIDKMEAQVLSKRRELDRIRKRVPIDSAVATQMGNLLNAQSLNEQNH